MNFAQRAQLKTCLRLKLLSKICVVFKIQTVRIFCVFVRALQRVVDIVHAKNFWKSTKP